MSSQLISCQRHLFDIPRDITYYNCAYLSPLAESVREAGIRGVTRKSAPWRVKPHHFFDESDRLRTLFAKLINGDPEGVAIVPSVSYGIETAARNIRLKPGQRVLVLSEQFPSNVYPWLVAVKKAGASLHTVERPENGDWTPAILDAIDHRIGAVALPQCHWTDGSMIDLNRIGRVCEDLSIPLVLDLTQSVGVIPFDVTSVRPAFLAVACYKWLLGPYGLALLYVDPKYRDGLPIENNWITRRDSQNFARLVDYTQDFDDGARRYDVGERSNLALLPMAAAALELILGWGDARIAATLKQYADALVSRVEPLGFRTLPEQIRAPHLTGLRFPGRLPDELAVGLEKEQVFVSIRGDAIRIAPHLYNDNTDLDRFYNALARFL